MQIERFRNRIYLSSPTMHGEELDFVKEAYETNWMTTIGGNIDAIEREFSKYTGVSEAVALSSGTAALHLAVKLAGVSKGDHVFCSDLTFAATVNPVVYEGGIPVLIDSERDTWNMDPEALRKAFTIYPETRVVIVVDLYGVPAKLQEIREICDEHGAVLIEDAAEALGATYNSRPAGSYAEYNVISFNGNKIITGSTGGMLLTNDKETAELARKLSTQSRDDAPWYQHTELGYNYRMSNVVAGVVRGQYLHLEEHLRRKKEIYKRYKEGFKGLPLSMNPFEDNAEPSFWLSCMLIDKEGLCEHSRTETQASYEKTEKKSCPAEILSVLDEANAEARPLWKPMHMQPIFREYPFVTLGEGDGVSGDLFARGVCLPSDIKMTEEEQDTIIRIIRNCFE